MVTTLRHIPFWTISYFVLIAILSALAFWFRAAKRTAPLRVDAPAKEIGPVWAQKAYRWSFDVFNPNWKPIHVTKFTTSCNCSATEPSIITIRPRKSAKMTLVLDLTSTTTDSTGDVRDLTVAVVPTIAGQRAQPPWMFRAEVHEVISIRRHDQRLELPVAVGAEAPVFELDVDVLASAENSFTSIVAEALDEFVETETSRADPYRVSAKLSRDAPVGFFETGVKLFGTTAAGKRVFLEQVLLSGYAVKNVYSAPRIVDFGIIETGMLHHAEVVLKSHRGPFRILASAFDSTKAIQAVHAMGLEAESCLYKLDVLPATEGNGREVVTFIVQDEQSEQEYEVTVPVSWFAVNKDSPFTKYLGSNR